MINGENAASSSELLKAQAQVWNCTFNNVNSMSLKCAVELGIADIIHSHGQPTTLSQIASALNIKPNKVECIQSVMRILVHSGFFAQQKDDEYFLTPASRLLLKDTPLKAAPFVDLVADPLYTTAFHCLGTWLQNDDPSLFETAHGKKVWDRVADEPKFKSLFYDLMITDSELIAGIVIKDCKEVFEGLKSLIDVAGGTGTLARAIATAFPDIKCTVFDLPHVVDNLQGTNDNLDFVGGNMFEAIPQANAVLLKWILHNWNDEESVKLLKKCKEAIPIKIELRVVGKSGNRLPVARRGRFIATETLKDGHMEYVNGKNRVFLVGKNYLFDQLLTSVYEVFQINPNEYSITMKITLKSSNTLHRICALPIDIFDEEMMRVVLHMASNVANFGCIPIFVTTSPRVPSEGIEPHVDTEISFRANMSGPDNEEEVLPRTISVQQYYSPIHNKYDNIDDNGITLQDVGATVFPIKTSLEQRYSPYHNNNFRNNDDLHDETDGVNVCAKPSNSMRSTHFNNNGDDGGAGHISHEKRPHERF
ncbi:probable O-methyltransferase 3 [Citrus sinensis]|uniref:probable O-methyltransferase 3 n=1 Tax=Citrus sinensis TaxID=2711 RepID=UPI0022793D3E|nr:probable O-methyltransferase 3 [Citrus sinensis]